MKATIGIDPGNTGAIAAIYPNGLIALHDTPVEEVSKGKKNSIVPLPSEMAGILSVILSICSVNGWTPHVAIEKVGAMPGQGVTSMFNFGKGYGMWIGILAALRIPYTFVTPQAWKKELMKGVGDKDAARGVGCRLFPEVAKELARKKDIGRADALLIAEWCRRQNI
jgi:crossover junction endodeoxyribonuclease RuvC